MMQWLAKRRQFLLTGVSYAIPFIAAGGMLIAMAITFAPMGAAGPDFSQSPKLKLILDIGSASFSLMLPVLAGHIAYAIAGKPGLVAGFIGGYLSGEVKAAFLGALTCIHMTTAPRQGLRTTIDYQLLMCFHCIFPIS